MSNKKSHFTAKNIEELKESPLIQAYGYLAVLFTVLFSIFATVLLSRFLLIGDDNSWIFMVLTFGSSMFNTLAVYFILKWSKNL